MRIIRNLFAIAVLALSVQAADVVVIANNSVADTEVSASDLKVIFLGTKTSLGSSHVEP